MKEKFLRLKNTLTGLSVIQKGISLSVAMLALWAPVHGQQNVNMPVPEKSPKVEADGTVTFHVSAPGARNVRLGGAFGGREVSEATESDGTYTFRFDSVSPDLYDYWFEIDGVRTLDPSNPYVARDIASLSNIFIVPGGKADWFGSKDVPHGSVHKVWYSSDLLGGERRMTVYTPPGYEKSEEHYPVLFLLHGMGGDEEAWSDLGRAIQILDNEIAAGMAEPMIVVMPNGNAMRQATPGMTGDGMYIPEGMHSVDPERKFEKSFPDIIRYVEDHYRVKTDKGNRAVAGLSMGGGHAWRLSMENPDTFGYVGLFSPAVRWNGTGVSEDTDPEMVAKLRRQFAEPPELYVIAIGEDDFLLPLNDAYRALLEAEGFPYSYWPSTGGHEWRNWRNYLVDFLPLLFK